MAGGVGPAKDMLKRKPTRIILKASDLTELNTTRRPAMDSKTRKRRTSEGSGTGKRLAMSFDDTKIVETDTRSTAHRIGFDAE